MPKYVDAPVQMHWCIDLFLVDLEDPLYIERGLPEGWHFVMTGDNTFSGWSGGCGYIRYAEVEREEK